MKILWSVNTLMPHVASKLGVKSLHAISWIDAMSRLLSKDKDLSLAIASTSNVGELKSLDIDNVRYYVLPLDDLSNSWNNIVNDFQPDVIHLYGTEKKHNIPLINKYADKIPMVISLQGILKGYERVYYGGIDVSVHLRHITFRDVLTGSVFKGRRQFQKGTKTEAWQLQHVKYVEGRSTWDRVYALSINPDLKYFYCPRLIREPFYTTKWNIDKVERHSIFVHQGDYPIKGLHFVFEALPTLIEKYPDLHLYIAGGDLFNRKTLYQKIKTTGYSSYLHSLYKKYNLKDYISFVGRMTAEEVAERLSHTHVMVIPSVIENCPNSLAEAMLVGTPSVASYVGGNAELLNNGECGELYCYNEPLMLANCIDTIFSSDNLALNFSQKARTVAMSRHNPEQLKKSLLEIYNQVIFENDK